MIDKLMARLGYVPKSELVNLRNWYKSRYPSEYQIHMDLPYSAYVKMDCPGFLRDQIKFILYGDMLNIDITKGDYTKIEIIRASSPQGDAIEKELMKK